MHTQHRSAPIVDVDEALPCAVYDGVPGVVGDVRLFQKYCFKFGTISCPGGKTTRRLIVGIFLTGEGHVGVDRQERRVAEAHMVNGL